MDQIDITVNPTTVEAPAGYTDTVITVGSFTPNGNGGYDWTETITTGAFESDSRLNQTIVVRIKDGTYATEKAFIISHKPSIIIPFADNIHGIEAWKTDGSTVGTVLLAPA
jgi:hypothetical protein